MLGCEICKDFLTKEIFKNACKDCGKTFKHTDSKDRHTMSEHDLKLIFECEKFLGCEMCKKTFSQKKILKMHVKIVGRQAYDE